MNRMAAMPIEAYRDTLPTLGREVFVHAGAWIIGDVVLGDRVSIWPGAVLRGDVNSIRVGAESNVQDNSVLHVSHRRESEPAGAALEIGARVTVGHGVILHGCRVGDECLVGMGALVMDHAVLEPRVLLAAGSLVPEGRVLESGWLYLGRPAEKVRRLTADELAHFAYQARRYVTLAAEYRAAARLDGENCRAK